MEFTKKNVKTILGIITFAVVLFAISQNLQILLSLLVKLLSVLNPVIVGLCIAFILNILMTVFEKRIFKFIAVSKKEKVRKLLRPVSLASTIIFTIGIFVILLFLIIPQLKNSVTLIINKVPGYYNTFIDWVDSVVVRFGLDVNTEFLHNPKINFDNISSILGKFFSIHTSNDIIGTTVGVTSSVVSGVINFVMGIIIAIYILADKERIGKFTCKVLETALPGKVYKKFREICSVASLSFSNFITGQFTDAVLLGTLCFIGMSILRLPNAAVVSVIIGISALIPVVGPITGEIFSCFIIFMESPIKTLIFIVFIFILQLVDNNLIYPRIMGKSVGVPGILILVAVLIGGNVGGLLGVLLGVPTASAVYALLLNRLNREYGEKKEVTVSADGAGETENSTETENNG